MDGFQRTLNRSLQFRLSIVLVLSVVAMAIIGAIMSYRMAFYEADHFQDSQLRQVAALLDAKNLSLLRSDRESVKIGDDDARIFVQVFPGSPTWAQAPEVLASPAELKSGLQTIVVNGISWRVLVMPVGQDLRVSIAQSTAERDEAAMHSAMRTLAPFALLIPIIVLSILFLIRKMFRPVRDLEQELSQRSDQDLHPLSLRKIPLEMVPLILAINRSFSLVGLAMDNQRRFIANAAHELRTPLTALSLQAERLSTIAMPGVALERVKALWEGIQRSLSLAEQLLTLARVQQASHTLCDAVSVQSVIRQTLEDLMPFIEKKEIDLEMIGDTDVHVEVRTVEFQILIKNLLDNAIRYTPAHGRIILRISDEEGGTLEIRDTGPGICEEQRQRVFDEFYRIPGNTVPGSGLGLSIVRAIANRIGASIALDWTNESLRQGLAVTIKFAKGRRATPDGWRKRMAVIPIAS